MRENDFEQVIYTFENDCKIVGIERGKVLMAGHSFCPICSLPHTSTYTPPKRSSRGVSPGRYTVTCDFVPISKGFGDFRHNSYASRSRIPARFRHSPEKKSYSGVNERLNIVRIPLLADSERSRGDLRRARDRLTVR